MPPSSLCTITEQLIDLTSNTFANMFHLCIKTSWSHTLSLTIGLSMRKRSIWLVLSMILALSLAMLHLLVSGTVGSFNSVALRSRFKKSSVDQTHQPTLSLLFQPGLAIITLLSGLISALTNSSALLMTLTNHSEKDYMQSTTGAQGQPCDNSC
jgi:hypothetical protein